MFIHIISSSCHADLNLKGSTFLIHPAQYLYCAGNHSTSIYIKLGRVTMSNSKIQRLNKQHESTWAELHKRLISMPFSYTEIFNPAVGEFVRNVSHSVSSSEGYFVPCLISTTAFLVGTGSLIARGDQLMPLNLYTVVIGPPTTGKSIALSQCSMEPLITIRDDNDIGNYLLERCTPSAMIKCVAEQKKVFIASPEIYDFLNKLLKNDEDHGTGEVQLLCELFSGERTSYRYATECTRLIPANTPCCMIGLTQVPYGVRLLCRLDQGSGLLDRFMFLFPLCLRPTPREMEESKQKLGRHAETFKSMTDIFLEVQELHRSKKNYSFTKAANEYLDAIEEDFINELNESLLRGEVTPKSKKCDIIQRLAVCLHVFNHVTSSLLKGRKPCQPALEVSLETVKKAQLLADFVESQKQVVLDVSF